MLLKMLSMNAWSVTKKMMMMRKIQSAATIMSNNAGSRASFYAKKNEMAVSGLRDIWMVSGALLFQALKSVVYSFVFKWGVLRFAKSCIGVGESRSIGWFVMCLGDKGMFTGTRLLHRSSSYRQNRPLQCHRRGLRGHLRRVPFPPSISPRRHVLSSHLLPFSSRPSWV